MATSQQKALHAKMGEKIGREKKYNKKMIRETSDWKHANIFSKGRSIKGYEKYTG